MPGRSKLPRPSTEAEIIHNATSYLPDQFLQTVSNNHTDRWGGDEIHKGSHRRHRGRRRGRPRWDSSRSLGDCPGMRTPDPRPTFAYLVTALRDKHPKMAYLHVIEPRVDATNDVSPKPGESNDFLREIWNGGEDDEGRIFISGGGHTREIAMHTVEDKGSLITFGRLYMSNLNLPTRLQRNLPLAPSDWSKFYQPGDLKPLGYNDWSLTDGSVKGMDGKI